MHALLSEVPLCEVQLQWNQTVDGDGETRARQFRGYLGRRFSDNPLFHQHEESGRVLYRYPRVHYRWQEGGALIVGWQDAAHELARLPWLELQPLLGEQLVTVKDVRLKQSVSEFGLATRLQRYHLATPVLLFNQKNYTTYKQADRVGKLAESDRLLVAQLLTAMRGLQVEFDGLLYAAFTDIKPVNCYYKQQELLGLRGQFICNAQLPSGFAIGHGVSHGYGWIKPDRYSR